MGHKETRDGWFKATGDTGSRDNERGANEGLSKREIKALADENSKAWGRKFGAMHVSKRGKDAGHK